jgi:hypothetical protein
MILESYDCELCILQKGERVRHIFYGCSFAKNCWNSIGIIVPTWLKPERASMHIKRSLNVPFAMDIIITMSWCIWIKRNAWIFNEDDPTVANCKRNFKKEFTLVIQRSKKKWVPEIQAWLENLV